MAKDYLNYFVLDKNLNKAKCKLCPDETPKLISFTTSSKTNLQTHFERKHKDEVKNLQQSKSEEKKTFQASKISSDVQHSITDAVVDFIIENDEPLSLTEQKSFHKFMSRVKPQWKPVCRKTVCAKIMEKGKPFRFNFAEYRRNFGKPSSTVDIWSSKQRLGYMAVTLHLQTERGSLT